VHLALAPPRTYLGNLYTVLLTYGIGLTYISYARFC